MSRLIHLVVLILAFGQAKQAQAVVVTTTNSAIFIVDIPVPSADTNVFTTQGLSIQCNTWPCASELYWPSPEVMEEHGVERSSPPLHIVAQFGTGPHLGDIGTFYGFGGQYNGDGGYFLIQLAI